MAAAGLVTLLFGACLLVASRFLRSGNLPAAVTWTCTGLLAAILLVGPLIPFDIPALTILPLVVVALALPYLSGRRMRTLVRGAWVAGSVTAVLPVLLPVGSSLPVWFSAGFQVVSTATSLGLGSLLLWHYSNRIHEAAVGSAAALAERELALERTRESEERFRSLFQEVPVSLWENDFSLVGESLRALQSAGVEDFEAYFDENPEQVLRIAGLVRNLDVNDRTVALFQAPNKEAIREGLPAIYARFSYVAFKQVLVALAAGERRYEQELLAYTLKGEPLNVILRISVPAGYEKSLSRVLMSTLDITVRKRAEEHLRRTSARALALAELSGSIAETGHDYQPVLESAAETAAEQIGEGCVIRLVTAGGGWLEAAAVFHPDPEIRARLGHPSAAGRLPITPGWEDRIVAAGLHIRQPDVFSDELREEGGSAVRANLDAVASRTATVAVIRYEGQPLGTVGVFRTQSEKPYTEADREFLQDVADRLALVIMNARLYREARRVNAELEERVARRTAQLEAINHELESFTYSVSHDLRGPLRHTVGYIELLQRHINGGLDEKGRRYIEIISSEAGRMGELIDDLLEFSRMGHLEMQETAVDFETLVEDVIRELAPEIAERRIKWQIESLPVVLGDRAMLRQVWVNLLSNAVKYTRTRDRASIAIDANYSEAGHVFSVRDNGVGFDMKYVEKLFGIFQRLHRFEDFEGTGIGLANVQRIVHRHGGRVWAEGEDGAGAAFFFLLPAARMEETT